MKVSKILSTISLIAAFAAFSTDASAGCQIDHNTCRNKVSIDWIHDHLGMCVNGINQNDMASCNGAISRIEKRVPAYQPSPPKGTVNCKVSGCSTAIIFPGK